MSDEKVTKFANVYSIKLLFKEDVAIDYLHLFHRLKKAFHEVKMFDYDQLLCFNLSDYLVTMRSGEKAPAQLFLKNMEPFDPSQIPQMALYQCWTSHDAQGLLEQCRYELTIADFLSSRLPRTQRGLILSQYLDILLDMYPECIALYWPHSQKFMPVEAYLQSQWDRKDLHFLDGGLNVRLFNEENSSAMVVDTTGMQALGIPDLQMRFQNLDCDFVVTYIYRMASYLFINGDHYADGDTMDGRYPFEKWECYHEYSLLGPDRVVLDIFPNEFSVYKRHHMIN